MKKLLIFIDESGIHKQIGHSTTVVVYIEIVQREVFEKQINAILKNLKISVFHWSDERWLIRNKFLTQAVKLPFKVKVALFHNPVHSDEMIELVFQHLIVEKEISSIFIDGKKPKWYERKLKKILRDKGISLKKLTSIRNESAFPGIQLADALAGLFRYHFDNPQATDAEKWFNKLKNNQKLFAQFIFEGK